MQDDSSEEEFPVDQDDHLKVKNAGAFSADEDILAMHAVQVGTDYFGRWVVTITDLDTIEITKLYEAGDGGNAGIDLSN